jgi:hypothetical protein
MTHTFKLARRAARFRVPLLASLLATIVGACQPDDLTDPVASADPVAAPEAASFASSFRGGIPIGIYHLPNNQFGNLYNGALRNIYPKELRSTLAQIKARGGKVVLMFAGSEQFYKSRGRFDMGKWKARINRFRGVDFSSYVRDGTVIGHFLIDEPNDAHNWGRPIPGATLDEMARYSKQLWPSMATIVRAEPFRLGRSNWRYLDAAWAQYTSTKGNINTYISRNSADARRMGLALVVGLNISKGNISRGRRGTARRPMTAQQIRSWGTTLLSSSYPCAFISWTYNGSYLNRRDIRSAMSSLRARAQSRSTKSCRSSSGRGGGDDDD